MTLLQLAARHDIAVIEMGTNQPGEIAKLAEMAEPQIGLLTMVSEAHTEGLGGLDGVLHEKAALFRALPVDGCAVTTGDDARCAQAARDSTADRVLLFGRTPSNDVVVLEQGFTQSLGTRARIRVSPGHGELEVNLMMPGEPAAMNAAAAVAVALGAGIGLESAGDALSRVPSAPGRMQVEEIGGRTVLDDSYNANPRSTSAAIKTLSGVARVRAARAVAFLGDMKELGAISLRAHTQIIAEAIEAQVDVFVGCGAEMGEAIIATAPRGEAGMNLHAMSDSVSAAGRVGEWTQPGDVVLVKGSRSMRMETIIDALRGMECAAP
jgi:UDP-N-acetylmuramoyl-tripeptide--D-alanyl-D-alanine ligase